MKRIKFNYKYLEDREKRAHHVLKLIHDKVCLLNNSEIPHVIIIYLYFNCLGQFKSTTAPCGKESDKLEVDELSLFCLHHKHGGIFRVHQSPDCICFGSAQPSARCL